MVDVLTWTIERQMRLTPSPGRRTFLREVALCTRPSTEGDPRPGRSLPDGPAGPGAGA
jgi:hypothetical protein